MARVTNEMRFFYRGLYMGLVYSLRGAGEDSDPIGNFLVVMRRISGDDTCRDGLGSQSLN